MLVRRTTDLFWEYSFTLLNAIWTMQNMIRTARVSWAIMGGLAPIGRQGIFSYHGCEGLSVFVRRVRILWQNFLQRIQYEDFVLTALELSLWRKYIRKVALLPYVISYTNILVKRDLYNESGYKCTCICLWFEYIQPICLDSWPRPEQNGRHIAESIFKRFSRNIYIYIFREKRLKMLSAGISPKAFSNAFLEIYIYIYIVLEIYIYIYISRKAFENAFGDMPAIYIYIYIYAGHIYIYIIYI